MSASSEHSYHSVEGGSSVDSQGSPMPSVGGNPINLGESPVQTGGQGIVLNSVSASSDSSEDMMLNISSSSSEGNVQEQSAADKLFSNSFVMQCMDINPGVVPVESTREVVCDGQSGMESYNSLIHVSCDSRLDELLKVVSGQRQRRAHVLSWLRVHTAAEDRSWLSYFEPIEEVQPVEEILPEPQFSILSPATFQVVASLDLVNFRDPLMREKANRPEVVIFLEDVPRNVVIDQFMPMGFNALFCEDTGSCYLFEGSVPNNFVGINEHFDEHGVLPPKTLDFVMKRCSGMGNYEAFIADFSESSSEEDIVDRFDILSSFANMPQSNSSHSPPVSSSNTNSRTGNKKKNKPNKKSNRQSSRNETNVLTPHARFRSATDAFGLFDDSILVISPSLLQDLKELVPETPEILKKMRKSTQTTMDQCVKSYYSQFAPLFFRINAPGDLIRLLCGSGAMAVAKRAINAPSRVQNLEAVITGIWWIKTSLFVREGQKIRYASF